MGAFIILLVGIVLIQSIADSVYQARNLNNVNETLAFTSQAGQTTYGDLTTVSYFGNSTNNTGLASVTIDTDVNWTRAGVITISEVEFPADGDYYIIYDYEGSGYVTNSTARTLLNLIIIFFAIAIVLVGYNLVIKGFDKL